MYILYPNKGNRNRECPGLQGLVDPEKNTGTNITTKLQGRNTLMHFLISWVHTFIFFLQILFILYHAPYGVLISHAIYR